MDTKDELLGVSKTFQDSILQPITFEELLKVAGEQPRKRRHNYASLKRVFQTIVIDHLTDANHILDANADRLLACLQADKAGEDREKALTGFTE